MSGNIAPFRLLAITPARHARMDHAIRAAVESGGTSIAILLRDRTLSPADLLHWAEALRPAAHASGALLLVHGQAEVARASGADGVHLPEIGPSIADPRAIMGARALVGVSRHDAAGVGRAAEADYATVSPIFPSPGKGPPLGLAGLAGICHRAPVPVVALGGVTVEHAGRCREAGASAIAAIRAVWEGDAATNVRALLDAFPPII